MRGKLRDKRSEMKRYNLKRESLERRRTNKRDNRSLVVKLYQQYEEEDNFLRDDEEVLVESTQK
jgi:ATP-dependent helicase/DNAse subunit B